MTGEFVFGTVTGTSGTKVVVKVGKEATGRSQAYKRLSSYSSPAVGDVVLMVSFGEMTYVILGKVEQ